MKRHLHFINLETNIQSIKTPKLRNIFSSANNTLLLQNGKILHYFNFEVQLPFRNIPTAPAYFEYTYLS